MYPRRVGRIRGFAYIGFHRYFLTFCTAGRTPCLRDEAIVRACVDEFLRAAEKHQFEITAYCLMPDHVHMLVEGLQAASHLPSFAALAKQLSGYRCRLLVGDRLWQPGYHDHVLRDDECTSRVARYLLDNPVRHGLVQSIEDYQFVGSGKYSKSQLIEWAFHDVQR